MYNSIIVYCSEVLLLRNKISINLKYHKKPKNLLHIYTNTPLKYYALIRLLKMSKNYENHFNEPIPETANFFLGPGWNLKHQFKIYRLKKYI